MPERSKFNPEKSKKNRVDSEVAWFHPWAVTDKERDEMVFGDPNGRKKSKQKKHEKI